MVIRYQSSLKGAKIVKPSRKFLSLPIITLHEGQHIGYVKSLILDPRTKSLAALVIDPKGFFKDQRIIPYSKVVSVGDDAITIDKSSQVEKPANLPEILNLLKEKLSIIGTRVVTESGKVLGTADEYFIESETGKVKEIEISGGKIEGFLTGKARLQADQLVTIGHDVIVAHKGSETVLMVSDKGLSDTFKNIIHTTSHFASETTQNVSQYFKKDKQEKVASLVDTTEPATDTTINAEDISAAAITSSDSPVSEADPDLASEAPEQKDVKEA